MNQILSAIVYSVTHAPFIVDMRTRRGWFVLCRMRLSRGCAAGKAWRNAQYAPHRKS